MSPDEFDALLRRRIEALTEWLQLQNRASLAEHKHLETGSPERLYWHLGYLVALTDLERARAGRSASQSYNADMRDASPAVARGARNYH